MGAHLTFAEDNMIRDSLLHEIDKTFPGWEMTLDPNSNVIVRFHCIQSDVGDVVIYDDGDEATVCIENISHGHFSSHDESLDKAANEQEVATDVIDFLKALFADQVLLYTTQDHRNGGWIRLDLADGPAQLSSRHRYFLWSKPYHQ